MVGWKMWIPEGALVSGQAGRGVMEREIRMVPFPSALVGTSLKVSWINMLRVEDVCLVVFLERTDEIQDVVWWWGDGSSGDKLSSFPVLQ